MDGKNHKLSAHRRTTGGRERKTQLIHSSFHPPDSHLESTQVKDRNREKKRLLSGEFSDLFFSLWYKGAYWRVRGKYSLTCGEMANVEQQTWVGGGMERSSDLQKWFVSMVQTLPSLSVSRHQHDITERGIGKGCAVAHGFTGFHHPDIIDVKKPKSIDHSKMQQNNGKWRILSIYCLCL